MIISVERSLKEFCCGSVSGFWRKEEEEEDAAVERARMTTKMADVDDGYCVKAMRGEVVFGHLKKRIGNFSCWRKDKGVERP